VLGAVVVIVAVCAATPGFLDAFIAVTAACPYVMSFLKFAVLATFGECIGLRITSGVYAKPGFGILPKALVWGVLGLGIKAAFTIFATGVPMALAEIGVPVSAATMKTGAFIWRAVTALCIATALNCCFGPVFMTLHRLTDMHIASTGGTVGGLLRPIPMGRFLGEINWTMLWGFVFKKTIPIFWIPAHTVTFLLPQHFQVVFAALLGVVLGVILAVAARQKGPRPA
jgi:hypothetical protein